MDFVYFYKATVDDFELRYSLRSIDRHAHWVRKIWIYGDKPAFLTEDTSVAEHVPDSFAASIIGVVPPVRNFFLMLFLSSLIPELSSEYIWCSDDHFLLDDYPVESAKRIRYLEDLGPLGPYRPARPGLWQGQLWRTRDELLRLGYPAYNFETHTPIHLTKRRVFNAYSDLRSHVSQDRFAGLMGATAILNHARRHESMPISCIRSEGSRVGWWKDQGAQPSFDQIVRDTAGKTFLNLGEGCLDYATRRFLRTRFPERSRYEKDVDTGRLASSSLRLQAFGQLSGELGLTAMRS